MILTAPERIANHFRTRTRGGDPVGTIPLTWNASVLDDRGGMRTTDFRIKWLNDLDSNNVWLPIDCGFRREGERFVTGCTPIVISAPKLATSPIIFANRQRYDCHRRQSLNADALEMVISHPGARPVEATVVPGREWQVVYPDALGDGVDIIAGTNHARSARAEHLYAIRREPPGNQEHIELTCEIVGNGRQSSSKRGLVHPGDDRRGVTFRPARAWYYDAAGVMHAESIEVVHRWIGNGRGGKLVLTKRIPRRLIQEALAARPGGVLRCDSTLTANPDSNPEANTFDGWLSRQTVSESWATIHDAASANTTNDSTATTTLCRLHCSSLSNLFQKLIRNECLFDTSSLGAASTISAATLSISGTAATTTLSGCTVNVYSSNPASNTAASAGDYSLLGTTAYCDTAIAFSSWTTDSSYNDFVLNAAGLAAISKTGLTEMGCREATYDAANEAPTWTSIQDGHISANYAETSGILLDPKLVVTYTPAATGCPVQMMHLVRVRQ